MAFERIRNVFHDYCPVAAAQIYAVPSGYQALVKPIRQSNVSAATTVSVQLYQGSGVTQRTIQPALEIDPIGLIIDETPIPVSSGLPLFASCNVASGVVLHVTAIETPA